MIKKRITAFLIAILTVFSCLYTQAFSVSRNNIVSVNKKIVVDTMTYNGVKINAYYTTRFSGYDSDMTSLGSKNGGYCCAGLIHQFYKKVYGVKVLNLYAERNYSGFGSGTNFKKSAKDGMYYNTPISSDGYFYRVSEPKVGDIVASDNHWAIAKKVSGDTVTLIEQNYWYNHYSTALINRKISKNNGNYWFFRYSGSKVANVVGASDGEDEDKLSQDECEIWTVCSDNGVNVRTGAGTKYAIKTAIPDGTIIYVTDKKISGGLLWGKCELGWCAIEYCDYVEGSCGKDNFTVSFLKNGASGKMSRFFVDSNKDFTLPENKLTKSGKNFLGWTVFRESDRKYLYTNGTDKGWYSEQCQPFGYYKYLYKNGETVSGITDKNNDRIEFSARWSGDKISAADLGFKVADKAVFKSTGAKPTVKVFYKNKYLKNKTDYKLSYSSNKAVGEAEVTVKMTGKTYEGNYSSRYTVIPYAVKELKANKKTKSTVTLSWKRNISAKGYMIYRLDAKSGKYIKIKTVTKNNTLTFKDTKLKGKTKYTYRIRAYQKVDGKYYYSSYKYIEIKTK